MHEPLARIAKAIESTPFFDKVWLVGGAVRDALLGRPTRDDLDLVTELSAVELAEFLWSRKVAQMPPTTYARFGTAMVRVKGVNVEIVTARRESYAVDSRKPDVQPASLHEDALRRDFTVNTLLQNLNDGRMVDPLETGMADLQAKILRTPRDPQSTFEDDPLRMLRAVRFRWKLGFAYAEGLPDAIRASAHRLEIVSGERIRDEFLKMLDNDGAQSAMRDLMELGLLERFAPEFRAMVGVEQGDYHHLDVWDHTLLVLRGVGHDDRILSLAALLHDVGKPATRSIDAEGATRFFEHERVGAEMARKLLQRLRFSGTEIDQVVQLVANHMRLGSWTKWTDSAGRRLIRDLGGQLDRLLSLIEADVAALKPGLHTIDVQSIRARLNRLSTDTPRETLESPLDGDEIMEALGIGPGEHIGRAKKMLEDLVLDGKLAPNDRQAAIEALAQWQKNPPKP